VLARVAVHFNAVTERFSPYDTDFPISTAKELRDTTLSAACSLHTASGSTSSSTSSLRRRRLMEIAEDEEEDNRKRQSTVLEERPGTAKSTSKSIPISEPPPSATTATNIVDNGLIPLTLPNLQSFRSTRSDLETSPPPPREKFDVNSKSPAKSTDEPQTRRSSQLTRPELQTYNTYSTGGRPKVKLGPRPSLDVVSSRPHTSGAATHYRPVSTLPSGLKIFGKGSRERPKSTYGAEASSTTVHPPPIPDDLSEDYQNMTPIRPHTSGGWGPPLSMKPLISPTSSKTPSMTPEKARLMKALEMRKKKSASAAVEPISPRAPDNLIIPEHETKPVSNAVQGASDTLAIQSNLAKDDDSAIAFDANSTMKTDESDATKSDSYPVSPTGQSEQAESTQASSISESADGTLQISNDDIKSNEELTADAEAVLDSPSVSKENSVVQPENECHIAGNTSADSETDVTTTPTQEDLSEQLQTEPAPEHLENLGPEREDQRENIAVTPSPDASVAASIPEHASAPAHSTPTLLESIGTSAKALVDIVANETKAIILPSEPVKADKHVTFDESEDHVIEDTFIPDDETVGSEYGGAVEEEVTVGEEVSLEEKVDTKHVDSEPATEFVTLKDSNGVAAKASTDAVPAVEVPTSASAIEDRDSPKEESIVEPTKSEGPSEPAVSLAPFANADSNEVTVPVLEIVEEGAMVIPSVPAESLPTLDAPPTVVVTPKSPVGSTFSIDSKQSFSGDERVNKDKSFTKRKKRGGLEPIRTDLELTVRSNANSDANLSSDDEFMDELQSAVMQEAKPISVSKSPISPMFPSPKKTESWKSKFSRAASNPLKKMEPESQLLTPPKSENTTPVRSVSSSAAYLKRIQQESASKPVKAKVNVGSGIAARMKAFEKFSSGPSTPPVSTGPPPGSTPAFFSVKKASGRVASRSPGPSVVERANSITRNTPPPDSRDSSPDTRRTRERERSGSIKNRVSTFESGSIPELPTSRSRPESISVTARIIRDPNQPYPPQAELKKDPSEYAPLDLKQSPLVIDHQRAVPAKETIQQRRQSKERRLSNSSDATNTTVKNRRSSVTIVKDLINERRASFAERRRSINLDPNNSSTNLQNTSLQQAMKSPSRPPSTHNSPVHNRSQSRSSRLSSSSNRDMNDGYMSPSPTGDLSSSEDKGSKKASRASRALRRMSSSFSSSRKALAHAVSPTVREESEPASNLQSLVAPQSGHPTPNINVGDVNVQFPDSLLWKRRSMVLDSQGFLILSPALTATSNGKSQPVGGATRKFHLSDFRLPVIPDMEIEELPNSVYLDLAAGGALQIACEDRAGQWRVLQILQDAHRSFCGGQ
jgi:hypothetical protein